MDNHIFAGHLTAEHIGTFVSLKGHADDAYGEITHIEHGAGRSVLTLERYLEKGSHTLRTYEAVFFDD